ncbi:L,D-transpeptidase [Sorangium sp. So ce296]|uniref:L,D-transpeptidase n=1 Tax=unclassified Sorangium TaxID=2621164 RepID=UPI003F5FA3B0
MTKRGGAAAGLVELPRAALLRRVRRVALRAGAAAVGLGAMIWGGAVLASQLPPWVAEGDAPLPAWVKSARVLKRDQPLFEAPGENPRRRGSVDRNVQLPIFAARRDGGCLGRWLEVGAAAWVCDDAVELSAAGPISPLVRTWREMPDGLPYRYYFVGPDGSFGYRRVEAADIDAPDAQLEPGFAVAIVEERALGGSRYGRTNSGLWVPMRDLGPVRAFAFHGATVPPGAAEIGIAWVVSERAPLFTRTAAGFARTEESKARFEVVSTLEEAQGASGKLARIADGDAAAWISLRDLRRPSVAPPPPEVDAEAGERWIDVERSTQTLVAYEGRRPVFATLVSTGKGAPGSSRATPAGTFRIWAKLLTSDMDNLEDEGADRYYRMEDVPYVQYFSKGVGLHGAFWHRSFGQVRSHGCVNLAPLDAQRLFWWTSPRLPAGWTAVLPTAHEPGTVVRVR